jgi:hypothetical protein
LAQDQLALNIQFNTPSEVERLDLPSEVKVVQPGDKLMASGPFVEVVANSPRLESYDIPEEFVQPPRVPDDLLLSAAESNRAQASAFFLNHLRTASSSWSVPMFIRIEVVACDGRYGLDFVFDGKDVRQGGETTELSNPDLIVEYPARTIESILAGEETLTRVQWWYNFKVRILRLIPGQMSVHHWSLQPTQFNG